MHSFAMKKILRPVWRDNRGVAIIEAAFALPLLLLLGLGGMELAHLVITHSRINQVGFSVADNASRIGGSTGDVREYDLEELATSITLMTQGMAFEDKGRVVLSSVERKADGTHWIRWQRCIGGLTDQSSYVREGSDLEQNSVGTGNGEISVSDSSQAIMLVEIFYHYEPFLVRDLFGSSTIRNEFAFTVREARNLTKGVVPTDGVDAKTC